MRGQPFVQLLLVTLAFVALGWPVSRLTRPAAAEMAVAPASSGPDPSSSLGTVETELTLTVAFVPAPEEFQLQALGRDLLAGHGPQNEWTGPWKTTLPTEGADLALRVVWPSAEAPAAAHVLVCFPDGRPPVDRTFWAAHGKLTELVTVPSGAP